MHAFTIPESCSFSETCPKMFCSFSLSRLLFLSVLLMLLHRVYFDACCWTFCLLGHFVHFWPSGVLCDILLCVLPFLKLSAQNQNHAASTAQQETCRSSKSCNQWTLCSLCRQRGRRRAPQPRVCSPLSPARTRRVRLAQVTQPEGVLLGP